jgi:hypothetical protein
MTSPGNIVNFAAGRKPKAREGRVSGRERVHILRDGHQHEPLIHEDKPRIRKAKRLTNQEKSLGQKDKKFVHVGFLYARTRRLLGQFAIARYSLDW